MNLNRKEEEIMECKNCSSILLVEDKFCGKCGHTVGQESEKVIAGEKQEKMPTASIGSKIDRILSNINPNEENKKTVKTFINDNLSTVATIYLLCFLLVSISITLGWVGLFISAILLYLYPLLSDKKQINLIEGVKKGVDTIANSEALNKTGETVMKAKDRLKEKASEDNMNQAQNVVHTEKGSDPISEAYHKFELKKKGNDPTSKAYHEFELKKKGGWLNAVICIFGFLPFMILIPILGVIGFSVDFFDEFLIGIGSLGVLAIIIVLIINAIYYLPALICYSDAKPIILLVNWFFGLTGIGWVILLIFAIHSNNKYEKNEKMMHEVNQMARGIRGQ